MARTKLEISRTDFINEIKKLEEKETFLNVQNLALAIAETEWAKDFKPKPITSPIATLRIKEWQLIERGEIKTSKGRRGRQSGIKLSDEQKSAMVSGRVNKSFDEEWLKALKANIPLTDSKGNKTDRFIKIYNKAVKGSIKAFLKLKCLDCSNWESTEVKLCTCISCPLWGIRPYKQKVA